MTDKLCLLPWIHLEADSTGTARPCCMWKGPPVGDFNTQNVDDVWHGEPMQQLREQFLAGDAPSSCDNCWSAERAGLNSKRQNDLARFAHHSNKPWEALAKPVYLDLKLGNICNIKCRICSSDYSFKWREDEIKLYGVAKNTQDPAWVDPSASFWTNLADNLDHLEFIDLTGGEPFLVKPMWRLLEQCVEQGVAHKISLHYNTNGTILPTPAQRKLWTHFKWVETMFSIDGIGAKFEYLRNPARWTKVDRTLGVLQQEAVTHTSICYTVNAYNVWDIPEFEAYAQSEYDITPYWNLLHGPAHYSIKNLPEHAKLEIATKIKKYPSIVKYMCDTTCDSQALAQFKQHTAKLDSIRKETFALAFPELYRILTHERSR